jgi:hypothetical protein
VLVLAEVVSACGFHFLAPSVTLLGFMPVAVVVVSTVVGSAAAAANAVVPSVVLLVLGLFALLPLEPPLMGFFLHEKSLMDRYMG